MPIHNSKKGRGMKRTLPLVTFIIVAALALGCASTDRKSSAAPRQSGAEAAQPNRDYTYAQKAAFIDKMKKELADMQEEMDRLSAKIDRSTGEAKADAKARLEVVREKWIRAKKQLDQAESATESTWKDVQRGFNKAFQDLKDSFDKARLWMSEKIKP